MGKIYKKINTTTETYKSFRECEPIFLKAHPELRGKRMTDEYLAIQIIDYYKRT